MEETRADRRALGARTGGLCEPQGVRSRVHCFKEEHLRNREQEGSSLLPTRVRQSWMEDVEGKRDGGSVLEIRTGRVLSAC